MRWLESLMARTSWAWLFDTWAAGYGSVRVEVLCRQLGPLVASQRSCVLRRVASHQVLKCLCICGVVPKCTRRDSWLICIALHRKLTYKSGVQPMLLPYMMTCMLSWRRLRLTMRFVWIRMIQMPEFSHYLVKVLQEGVMSHEVCPKPTYSERLPDDHVFCEFESFLQTGFDDARVLYFFEVRHYEKYAQVHVCNTKFDNLSQGDHVWQANMLEVNGRWEGEVSDGPFFPFTYCDENNISKKLDLEPDMSKVQRTLNIPVRFLKWRWLLSEYRKKADGLPPA
ncbi:unnamed protein product [Prunus armeniaca]